MLRKNYTFILSLLLIGNVVAAQSTFNDVVTILKTNCAFSGCHGAGSNIANLNFDSSAAHIYGQLVNIDPVNPAALTKGNKLVDPGYPERSFLLRKLATDDWDNYYKLDIAEGNPMPSVGGHLDYKDIELVRQWINYGAPQNGTVVDPSMLEDFYNGLGKAKVEAPPAPAENEGFQARLGSFFLEPLEEVEFFKKYQINFPDDIEVTRMEVFFNEESHHFITYRVGDPNQTAEGLRPLNSQNFISLDNPIVAAWQDPNDLRLPETTAYFWKKDETLDLNYHLINYDTDSILAADAYINIYTQPKGTADQEMFSQLIPVDLLSGGPLEGVSLEIPNDGMPHTFTETLYHPLIGAFLDPVWHVWLLSSHTHQRGIDYDIYMRNQDGSRGEQLFEGYYDFTYSFDQGFYDWEHPPIRYFEPPFPKIELNKTGFIHEATFVNNGPNDVYWGFTTQDEMMLFFVQYTKAPLSVVQTGVEEVTERQNLQFIAVPNPFNAQTAVRYELPQDADVTLEAFNMLGERVEVLASAHQQAGNYSYTFDVRKQDLSMGVYLLKLTVDGQVFTHRVLAAERR